MSTVYTVNGKVLKNSANDKWLIKKEAPAGFVMNASNATYHPNGSTYNVWWQTPAPGYNGNGKQYILVNNNASEPKDNPLFYASDSGNMASPAIGSSEIKILGTSTGVLLDNVAGATYGSYFIWVAPVNGATLEQLQAYMANVSITIVDP